MSESRSQPSRVAGFGRSRTELLFRCALILSPIVLFLSFETVLRLVDYGGDSSLFVPTTGEHDDFYGLNPDVARRYFSVIDDYPIPRKDLFLQDKAASAYRIFALGGSTMAGFPYGDNLTFTRILHRRLLDAFPDRRIEMVNTGMSAINTHTLLDFMDEILEHEPDALLIYTGHNEFYGALGVGSVESLGRFRWAVKLFLKLQRFKTFQLLRDGVLAVNRGAEPTDRTKGTVMARIVRDQTIPLGSDLYERGREQFIDNLREILEKARAAGVPVLLSELVSNVGDHAPFAAIASSSAPPADRVFAEAQALEKAGRTDEARRLYYRAKDLDALRFRAPEDFNTVINELAGGFETPVVPMQARFEEACTDGIIGNEMMLEHLHPNIDGYFLMADAFFDSMRDHGFIADEWLHGQFPSPHAEWAYTELDSVYGALKILNLKGGWPFQEMGSQNLALRQYRPQTNAESIALEILRSGKSIEWGHGALAESWEKRGNWERVFAEHAALAYTLPYWVEPFRNALDAAVELEDYDAAVTLVQECLRFQPTAFGFASLARIHLLRAEFETAARLLERALKLRPDDGTLSVDLTRAYYWLGFFEKGDRLVEALDNSGQYRRQITELEILRAQMKQAAN